MNDEIKRFNDNLLQSSKLLINLKKEFWSLMRYEKEGVLKAFENFSKECTDFCNGKKNEINQKKDDIKKQQSIIANEEKKVVNVHKAVEQINKGLLDIGITNFKIVEAGNDMYQIEREGCRANVFKSLSEGEKMIISLLYFIETCKGSLTGKTISKRKIVTIDDPISSLSHIYIFNIGMLLKKLFTSEDSLDEKNTKQYEQIFFVQQTVEKGWSRSTLLNMLSTDLYERQGKALTNFERTLPA